MYFNWKDKTNIDELKVICNLIKNSEIIIFPTETVYGIGANAFDSAAVGKIFLAKGRQSDNPLIVHLSDKSKIEEVAEDVTEVEQKLIDAFMPGPFTIILKKKPVIPDIVTAGLDTVAIRIPSNIIARGIITYAGVPIAAPSANISGKPSGTNIEDIRKELEGRVSAIIDGGKTEIGLESTVVRVIDGVPVILRPGKITLEEIRAVVGTVRIDDKAFKRLNDDETPLSPGMKYRHYAPTTKCKLVYADNEAEQVFQMKKLVKEYKGNVVVLGFDEHEEKIVVSQGRYIRIGSKENLEEIAQNIYTALRKADTIKADIILIEGIKKYGIGVAIMNRLLRTCEYDYIEVLDCD